MKPIRHIFFLLFTLCATSFFASAQAINPQWLNGNGGIGIDQGKSVAKDKNGFFYSLSEFSDVITVGANTYTSSGSTDLLLLKYNSSGQIIWSKQLGSTAADVGTNLFIDTLGYLYITGNFSGPAFNYGSGSLANLASGRLDIFLLRMDMNGSVLWAKSFRGLGDDYGGKVFSNGKDVLVTGYFQSSNLFIEADVLVNLSFRPIYLARFDSAGVYKWSKTFGGGNTDIGTGVTMDANGNIYMSGNVGSTNLNFGNGVSIVGTATPGITFFDVFLTRFNGDGLAQWSKVIKGASLEEATDLEMDEFGNAYIAGFFNSALLDFGSFSFSNPGNVQQFYIARYDSTGGFKWAVKSANTVTSRITDIGLASSNQIYATGYFSGGPLNLDVSLTNTGGNDVFWLQVDSTGVFQKSGSLKGTDDDRSGGITATSCAVILNGSFRSLQLSAGSLTVNNTNAAANDIFHVMLARTFPYALPADTLRVCENTTLLDAGSGYNSYYWNTNSRLQQITADVTGRYGVKVFNSEACYGEDSVYVAIVKANIFQNDTIVCKGGAPILLQTDTTNLTGTYWQNFNRNMTANWNSPQFSTIPEARYRMIVSGTWAPLNWPTQRLDAAYLYNLGDNSVIRSWVSPADNPAPFLFNGVPLRPLVDQYRTDHMYDYRFTTSGLQFGFSFNEVFTGDNSGALDFNLYYLNNPTTTAWSTGETSNSILVDPATTTKYYVTVTDGFATCKDSINITVLDAPIITLADTIKICADSVELDAGAGADTYQWSNGATTQKTKVYTGGKYYVTVKNAIGCERLDSVFVSMFRSNIIQNDTAICKNSSLTLDAQTSTGFSYSWSTGASTSSISIAPAVDTKIYLQTNNGIFTCTDSIQVNTLALPVLSVPDTLKICGTSTTLDAGAGFATYQWSTGELTQTINVAASGKYYIDVTNAATCGVRDSIYVSLINAVVTQNDTAICKGNSLVLNAQNVPGYTYSWSNGAVGLTTTVTPLVNTKYYLTASDGIASCKDSVQVDVLALPVTNILDTIKVCGTSTTLDAGAGFATYQWSTGATTQTINVSASGKYYIDVTNAATCGVRDSIYVSLINAVVTQNDTAICKGNSLVLNALNVPGYNYSWSNGAVGLTTTVTPLVNTKYYLTATDGIGSCKDSVQVDVLALPSLSLPDTIKVCGTNTTLDAGAGFASYQWSTGANTQTINVSASGKYYIDVTNSGTCASRDSIYVSLVNAVVTQNDTAICKGNSLVLNALNVPGYTYSWSNGAVGLTTTVTPLVNTKYYLTATDGIGSCKDSVQVDILALPVTSILDTIKVCGTNTTLDAGAGFATYQWSTGATSQTINVSTSGKYYITVTNAATCSAKDSIYASIVRSDILQGDTTICKGSSLLLPAFTQGSNTYSWSTGQTGTSILVSPLVDTKYYLQTSDGIQTCTDSTLVQLHVINTTVTAQGPTTFCAGGSVTLKAVAGYSYQWKKNGVVIAGATLSDLVVDQTGSYKAFITNAAGCIDSSLVIAVTVNALPTVTLSPAAPIVICEGSSSVISALVVPNAGGATQYQWSLNAAPITGANAAAYSVTAAGSYTVAVTNSNGCVNTSAPVPVSVSLKPVVTITNTLPVSICAGASQTINATVNAGNSSIVSRQWYKDGVAISGANGNSYLVTVGGQYRLEAINAEGCVGISATITVVESALPTPTLIPPAVNKICRGAYSTITATGGSSYEWYLNGVLIPGATADSWNAVDPGTYTVKAINAAGCSAMAAGSVVLTVIEPPSADFSIDAKCAGAPTTFTNLSVVAPTDIVNYTWTVGDGTTYTTVDASHIYARGGNYTVTLSAASTACSFAPSVKPVVINIEQARAGITYPPINAVAGRPTALQARNFGQTYNWTPALGLSNTTIPNPVATLGGPQTYNVQISTVSGCVTVDTVLVRIFSRGDIFVPTGFTPNNDGKNDRLYPILAGMNSLTYFKVYNRWGNLVYETKSSDPANGWNGMYNGQMQPVETYVWMAEGIDIDGNKIQRKGTAVLIR